MSSFSMDTRSMSSSPLVNSLVKNRLFKTAPDIDEPSFQFIHTMDLSVVDTMLHDSLDLVIHLNEIWAVWRLQVGRKNLWRLDAAVQLLHVRGAVCWCTVLLEHKVTHYQTLCVALAAQYGVIWRREAASNKSVRDITRISCFVTTMKLPHELQQQTIGKVGNSITCLWADNLCLQQWKNYWNLTAFVKVMFK